jgi:hypothetical protein
MWPPRSLTLVSIALLTNYVTASPLNRGGNLGSAAPLEKRLDLIPFDSPPFILDFVSKKEKLI